VVADLHGLQHIAWVFTAFMVHLHHYCGGGGPAHGPVRRKPFFLIGIAILVLGSALAGMSQSMTELIIFRGIQGFGAGMIMATAWAIIGDVFARRSEPVGQAS